MTEKNKVQMCSRNVCWAEYTSLEAMR